MKAFLLNLINTAFLYNGDNPAANAYYITQKLNNSTYSGNWNTIIAVNCTYPSGYGAFHIKGLGGPIGPRSIKRHLIGVTI